MKKKVLRIILGSLGVGLILAGCFLFLKETFLHALEVKTVVLENGETLFVETARTPWQKMQGLSGTEQVPRDGLLFVYDTPENVGIWMKDMRFSIDIVWIADGRVVHVVENAQPDDRSHREVYQAGQAVDYVLELEAGRVQKEGLKEGSRVEIE